MKPGSTDHDILHGPKEALAKFERQHPHTHQLRVVLLVAVITTLLIGGVLSVIASQHSFRNVTVGNTTISSNLSLAAIENTVQNQANNYELQVEHPDGTTKNYGLNDIGISIDAEATANVVESSKHPARLLKRLEWWHYESVPLEITVHKKQFNSFINSEVTQTVKKAKNARLKIDNGKMKILAEKPGTAYTLEDTKQTIKQKVADLDTAAVTLEKRSIEPAIKAENTREAQTTVTSLLSRTIRLKLDGQVITASKSDIGAWIDIEPVEDEQTVDISVNSGKVVEYIDAIAAPYVSEVQNKVVLKKDNGETTVIEPGQAGSDVVNKDELSVLIVNAMTEHRDVTAVASIKRTDFETVTTKSYPKSLVVNTSTKRMYAYEKNRLVRTFLVSAGAPATPTVTGSFAIQWKVRSQDMSGANTDGSRYFQPNVEWVNYFYQDYAIHGNYWRPVSYFGSVNSSHGCVGLLNHDAEWVYNWAPVGTPVTVHN